MATPRPLSNDELGEYLPTGLGGGVAENAHRETSFTVNKTNDPTHEPFLLIACPSQIIT